MQKNPKFSFEKWICCTFLSLHIVHYVYKTIKSADMSHYENRSGIKSFRLCILYSIYREQNSVTPELFLHPIFIKPLCKDSTIVYREKITLQRRTYRHPLFLPKCFTGFNAPTIRSTNRNVHGITISIVISLVAVTYLCNLFQ